MIRKLKIMFCKILSFIIRKEIIIDISGVILTPDDCGKNCKGNGSYKNWYGKPIECCCDECDYLMDCCNFEKMLLDYKKAL